MTGYYGKVSTHGDFVSRRLSAHLVQAWDLWLQDCMRASQEALGAAWLERYLNSPVWRFAIAPGVLGPEGLGGVMMPSVDRVGRYFPLVVGTPGAPSLLDWFHEQAAWYDVIENLARESLNPEFSIARLDSAPEPIKMLPAPAMGATAWRLPLGEDMSAVVAGAVLHGHTLWWTEGGPFVESSMQVHPGMPHARAFTMMLDSSDSISS